MKIERVEQISDERDTSALGVSAHFAIVVDKGYRSTEYMGCEGCYVFGEESLDTHIVGWGPVTIKVQVVARDAPPMPVEHIASEHVADES